MRGAANEPKHNTLSMLQLNCAWLASAVDDFTGEMCLSGRNSGVQLIQNVAYLTRWIAGKTKQSLSNETTLSPDLNSVARALQSPKVKVKSHSLTHRK